MPYFPTIARLAKAERRADRFNQSILAKAFRGELVPTEAELARREGRDYQPASVLLERIKKQREEETAKSVSTKRKAAQKTKAVNARQQQRKELNRLKLMRNPWLDLPSTAPYVLPCDRDALSVLIEKIKKKGKADHTINLDSLPEPFIGNPESATVLLLSLNPSDHLRDAAAHNNPAFREALLSNLRHSSQLYPFYALHPEFEWTGCGDYWTSHLRWLLEHPLLDRKCIAERLLVADWFPYHSKKSGVPLEAILPSQQYGFEMVKQAIGKKLIVGLRAKPQWRGVDARLALVPYLRNFQSPYVSPNNCGEELFNKIVEALKC